MAESRNRREELAWAAGFYDGEGSTLSVHGNRGIRVCVNQVVLAPLVRFKEAVGCGVIYGPYKRPGKASDVWHYRAQSYAEAQHVIAQLWTWLGDTKREQARVILERLKSNPDYRPVSKRPHKDKNVRRR